MTQGKIERYHRSMKNLVKLEQYYYPWELEKAIGDWVHHYNHERYHETLVWHWQSSSLLFIAGSRWRQHVMCHLALKCHTV